MEKPNSDNAPENNKRSSLRRRGLLGIGGGLLALIGLKGPAMLSDSDSNSVKTGADIAAEISTGQGQANAEQGSNKLRPTTETDQVQPRVAPTETSIARTEETPTSNPEISRDNPRDAGEILITEDNSCIVFLHDVEIGPQKLVLELNDPMHETIATATWSPDDYTPERMMEFVTPIEGEPLGYYQADFGSGSDGVDLLPANARGDVRVFFDEYDQNTTLKVFYAGAEEPTIFNCGAAMQNPGSSDLVNLGVA